MLLVIVCFACCLIALLFIWGVFVYVTCDSVGLVVDVFVNLLDCCFLWV